MRWFVEVAEGSHAAAERLVVEAAHWQPALRAARSLRGELGETTGFSVELLEDGFRAIDPSTLVRYVLRLAPEETPLSRAPEPKPAEPTPAELKPTEPKLAEQKPAEQKQPELKPKEANGQAAANHAKTPAGDPLRAAASAASSKPTSTTSFALHLTESAVPLAMPRPVPAEPKVVPAFNGGEALPPAELLYEREEDSSPSSPLTYRESAWLVPEGTTIEAATRLLLGTFEGVRAALAGVHPGKLVNMAVFDHRFQGKPQRPPVVTLSWKDWLDQGQGPELRRPSDRAPSINPRPPADVVPLPSVPKAAPLPPVIAPAPQVAPVPQPEPAPPAAIAPVVADVVIPAAAAAPAVEPVAPSHVPAPMPPPDPAPAPVAEQQPPSASPSASARGSAPSLGRRRLVGEELIADLFEAMHDLHFLRDPFEGADFVLSLVMDKLPSQVGLVHFYDIDAREFVVVRALGPGAAKLLGHRTSEKESVVADAMRKRRAVVVAAVEAGEKPGRWEGLEVPARSFVCAPVELAGRFLGLLELCNPRDETAFGEGDGHALTYIGEQFAEFLGARTIVLGRTKASN